MIAVTETGKPAIGGIPLCLGDIVIGPEAGPMTAGRVKGWSPSGDLVYVGWLGVVPLASLEWCSDLATAQFPGLYRPVVANRWGEAIALGLVPIGRV